MARAHRREGHRGLPGGRAGRAPGRARDAPGRHLRRRQPHRAGARRLEVPVVHLLDREEHARARLHREARPVRRPHVPLDLRSRPQPRQRDAAQLRRAAGHLRPPAAEHDLAERRAVVRLRASPRGRGPGRGRRQADPRRRHGPRHRRVRGRAGAAAAPLRPADGGAGAYLDRRAVHARAPRHPDGSGRVRSDPPGRARALPAATGAAEGPDPRRPGGVVLRAAPARADREPGVRGLLPRRRRLPAGLALGAPRGGRRRRPLRGSRPRVRRGQRPPQHQARPPPPARTGAHREREELVRRRGHLPRREVLRARPLRLRALSPRARGARHPALVPRVRGEDVALRPRAGRGRDVRRIDAVHGGYGMSVAPAVRYQGTIHELQKELMTRYYGELTDIAEGRSDAKNAHLLIAGNPVEILRAFDILPVYPEVNALQLAVRKVSLPLIQKAEEFGYATDNCAYVKADIGLFHAGGVAPFGTVPKADLLLCNYVGCNVYLNWFEHLAELTGSPAVNIDIPFIRTADREPTADDIHYVVAQLEELIALLERITR